MTLRQPKRRAPEHRLHRGRRRRVAQSDPALLNTAVNTEIRSLRGKHQSKTRDGSHYFCTKQRFTSTDSRASEPRTQRAHGARAAPRNSNRPSWRERFPISAPFPRDRRRPRRGVQRRGTRAYATEGPSDPSDYSRANPPDDRRPTGRTDRCRGEMSRRSCALSSVDERNKRERRALPTSGS